MLRSLAVLLALIGGAANAAAADAVLVTAPRGVSAKLATSFNDALKRGVSPQRIVKGPALKVTKMNDRAQALTQACAAKRTAFAVDTMVVKGRLSVIVVSAQGDTVFEKTGSYPKAPAKQKLLLLDTARGAASAIKASAPVAPPTPAASPTMPTAPQDTPAAAPTDSNNDAFSAGAAPPWMATSPTSPKPAPPVSGSASSTGATSEGSGTREPASKPKRDGGGRGDFRIAIGAVGGGGGYKEHIDSSRNQGDRDVKISMAPLFGGQLELEHAVGFRLDAGANKQKATLKPDITDPEDIKLDALNVWGRLSQQLTSGEVPIALAIGGTYEKVDAGTQSTVLWVPSSKLITTFLGVTASSGDLTTVGFTFEGGAGVVPWGKHSRTADTVKTDSRAFGGQGFLRGRYQFPKALGSSAGVFIEAGAQLRYLTFSPGSVTLPADDGTVRTNALPVGDESSNRLDYAASLSVGLMWRPGD